MAKDRKPEPDRTRGGASRAGAAGGKGGRARPPVTNVVAPQRPWGLIAAAVAVLGVLRALDDDVLGHRDGQRAAVDGGGHGGADDVAQLLGCHRTSVLTGFPCPVRPSSPRPAFSRGAFTSRT